MSDSLFDERYSLLNRRYQELAQQEADTFTAGPDYRVNSSGQKVFPSGAMRDSNTDKPRYDLIDPVFLRRFAEHMRKGAEHYGEHNWIKGIPSSNYMSSLIRHIEAYRRGERDEDHLSAAAFNLMGLMRNEHERTALNDLFDWNT